MKGSMNMRSAVLGVAAVAVVAAIAPDARAERVRYHFAPADLCGKTAQTAAGPCNAIGERVSYFGRGIAPYNAGLRPTYLVTFVHPATKQNVTIPLALPDDTPRIEYRANRAF